MITRNRNSPNPSPKRYSFVAWCHTTAKLARIRSGSRRVSLERLAIGCAGPIAPLRRAAIAEIGLVLARGEFAAQCGEDPLAAVDKIADDVARGLDLPHEADRGARGQDALAEVSLDAASSRTPAPAESDDVLDVLAPSLPSRPCAPPPEC